MRNKAERRQAQHQQWDDVRAFFDNHPDYGIQIGHRVSKPLNERIKEDLGKRVAKTLHPAPKVDEIPSPGDRYTTTKTVESRRSLFNPKTWLTTSSSLTTYNRDAIGPTEEFYGNITRRLKLVFEDTIIDPEERKRAISFVDKLDDHETIEKLAENYGVEVWGYNQYGEYVRLI